MGYDYVPGNLAGALALREAGANARARRRRLLRQRRSATASSAAARARRRSGMIAEPSYALRDGRLRSERAAKRRSRVRPRPPPAGDLDRRQRAVRAAARAPRTARRRRLAGLVRPGVAAAAAHLGRRGSCDEGARRPRRDRRARPRGSSTARRAAPTPRRARAARSHAVAIASDASGAALATVRLEGVSPYDFTAEMLAWAALRAADGGLTGSGALGPVDAFGLDALEGGVAQAGISRVA